METSICRCCASEGAFKDVKSTYHWMGEEEIYADMLKECFDINLFQPEGAEDSGICEVCITQLRNAVNFKKQVLHTEEQFKKQLQSGKMFKPSIVKVEVPMEHHDSDDDDHASAEDGYSEPDFEIPIKIEDTEETEKRPKSKKRAAPVKKSTSTRAKKAKIEEGEPSTKHNLDSDKEDSVSPTPCEVQTKLTLDRKLNFSSFITIRPVGKRSWLRERKKTIAEEKRRRFSELDWQFDNIRTVLKCSNATPMRCRVGARFACSYCLDQFLSPAELRSHSIEDHLDQKPEFFNFRSLAKYIVYLDITDLKCNICDDHINGLEELIDHLKIVHDELIHKKIKNQIVPFKYEQRKILCGVCSKDIGDYNDLQDHMCEHFRNYICRFCDAGFVIKSKMMDHKKIVHLV